MSKIIVLNDEAFDSLVGTLKQAMDDSKCLADWLNAKAHAELIESQKDAKRSVLEWHPTSEKPEIDRIILVRHKSKDYPFDVYKVCPFILNSFDRPRNNIKEWTYLLEEQTA